MTLATELAALVGADHVEADVWLTDASGLGAGAPLLVHPACAEEVRRTVAWAYERDVAIVAVGGRSGYSGGIVPEAGRPPVAVALDRLTRIRSFDPLLWRIEVEAGVTTATVQRLARENGLLFPPDPGWKSSPAPVATIPVVAGYPTIAAGIEAIEAALASNVVPAAIEYLQGDALRHAPPPFLDATGIRFLVICEAESEPERNALLDALGPGARTYPAAEVWRWRGGVSLVVRAVKGEKLAEDIAVPLDRLGEAIERTLEIGERHGVEACSWGHAGDGNTHSTFLFDPDDADDRARAAAAADDLFALARELGGTVSGEHGVGKLKVGQLSAQWDDAAVGAHEAIKRALDPRGLFNPGTKDPRPVTGQPAGEPQAAST